MFTYLLSIETFRKVLSEISYCIGKSHRLFLIDSECARGAFLWPKFWSNY